MSEIPRIIHQIWYQGEDQVPEKYRRYRRSWQEHHPEWEYWFWDAPKMRDLLREQHDWFLPYYDDYPKDIQRINSIRYFILYTFGGFHFDLDTRCVKPIDPLLESYSLILSKTVGFNAAIVGSTPRHYIWPIAFDLLKERHEPTSLSRHPDAKFSPRELSHSAGVILFNDLISQSGVDEEPGTRVCPGSYFEPDAPVLKDGLVVSNDDSAETYAIHDMDLLWFTRFQRFKNSLTKPFFRIVVAFNTWRTERRRRLRLKG